MPRGMYKRRKYKKKNSNPAINKLKETIKRLQTAIDVLQSLERNN